MITYETETSKSIVERQTITLTADMMRAVRKVVESEAYASSSEVVREALHNWQHKRRLQERKIDTLRADVRAGLDHIEAAGCTTSMPGGSSKKGPRRKRSPRQKSSVIEKGKRKRGSFA